MKDSFTVASEFRPLFQEINLTSLDSILRYFEGNAAPRKKGVTVKPFVLEGPGGASTAVYYKQYNHRRPAWRFIGRPSKAACEYRNYHAFKRLGIPSAEPVAWGERRDWMGRLCLSFIVTRAIPGAVTLIDFVAKHCERPVAARGLSRPDVAGTPANRRNAGGRGRGLGFWFWVLGAGRRVLGAWRANRASSPNVQTGSKPRTSNPTPTAQNLSSSRLKIRRSLLRQIASMTRRLHEANFFHRDLYWRNLLVTWQSPEEPRVWFIDCPRGRFVRRPFQSRRALLKELAALDKLASQYCAPRERVLFVKLYLGRGRREDAKPLIRRVLRYRKRRWPEDWKQG